MNNATRYTFHLAERLKSRKIISSLFKGSSSFSVYPIRIVWRVVQKPYNQYPALFAVSVPKKNFKTAVARNRIRRQIKEAYRLHKGQLYTQLNAEQQLACMFLYVAKEAVPYNQIEKSMQRILYKLPKQDE